MSHKLRQEYLNHIRERYQKAHRYKKTEILNEFTDFCSYSRKYAIHILNGKMSVLSLQKKRGRKKIYNEEVVRHVVRLWSEMGYPCSLKLKAALPLWIPYDEVLSQQSDLEIIEKIVKISRSQLDRLLKPYRVDSTLLRGLSSTVPSKHFRNKIPIQPKDWNVTGPGIVQADTVVHCGSSLAGIFVNSLTVVDIYSGWTEVRAVWGKGTWAIIGAMKSIENSLPFDLIQFKSDSGTEFINNELYLYFNEYRVKNKVRMVRSRPYKKDDNCYVEQKNFTHVRELFGYNRIDEKEALLLMNDIYQNNWCNLQNLFMPSIKLLRKTRIGSKIKKEYDEPQTPYERLMKSEELSEEHKVKLKHLRDCLNPFKLKQELDRKLKAFNDLMRKKDYFKNL